MAMRITYITAGAGGSYCGACARDVTLVSALRAGGHDVQMLALYTPLRTDRPDPSLNRVFYGGINTYLQQRFAVCRRMPEFVDWFFDRPALLKLASGFAVRTRPEELGDMTVSVLRGADGLQRKELEKLIRFLERQAHTCVVHLTNSLLAGLVPEIKRRLGVPVVCTLQGEESFLARLPQPYRDQALALLRRHAQIIDLFVAPGEAYADEMCEFLRVARTKIRVVRTGIDVKLYATGEVRVRQPFRIGFLSRICPAKGLDLLIEAFSILERQHPRGAVLAVAGEIDQANRQYWRELLAKLETTGLSDRLDYRGAPDFEGKVKFLRSCSVFCLPSRLPERRALACIEALAAGVPVVVPERGVFPEILELAGGGVLVAPDSAQALADAIALLERDPQGTDRLGKQGAAGVAKHFSATAMVEKTLQAYQEVILLGSRG